MTDLDGWEPQPGGLLLRVSRFDKANAEHQAAGLRVVRDSIQKVAQIHGALVRERGFRSNMRALFSGDIRADLLEAKWEICARKSIILGASLNWDVLAIDPLGRVHRAIHTEDLCILDRPSRQLMRKKPHGKKRPQESLAACFERISLQNMLKDDGASYKVGEVDPDNTKMIRALNDNRIIIGTGPGSAVLEFKRFPNNLLDRLPMGVRVIKCMKDGVVDEKKFIVRWKYGPFDIRFLVTKGQATTLGQPRVDIWPWRKDNLLPEQNILECVIASSLLAIKHEAENRNWGNQQEQVVPSPVFPLFAPRSEILIALYDACGHEILINADDCPTTFNKPIPDAHIYVMNDQRMLDAFIAVGAMPRVLGNKPTKPAVYDLTGLQQRPYALAA